MSVTSNGKRLPGGPEMFSEIEQQDYKRFQRNCKLCESHEASIPRMREDLQALRCELAGLKQQLISLSEASEPAPAAASIAWEVNDAALLDYPDLNDVSLILRVISIQESTGAPVVKFEGCFLAASSAASWERCGRYKRRWFRWAFVPYELESKQCPE